MKVIKIETKDDVDIEAISRLLEERAELHAIDLINWDTFSYQPKVHFRIAHNGKAIWLKFYVEEEFILAERSETNSATHRDSCVEFFIDPLQDGNYYNFEFNCIGTTHLAYGPDRKDRSFIDAKLIKDQIKTMSSLGDKPFEEKGGGHSWEMTVVIPAIVFSHSDEIDLQNLKAKANFYKCADDTSRPHYLTWNAVGTERPDFHQPVYFGNLVFE
ncbi:carbohydrate-binding family 9-like protein [Pareuzebyella sediminis]|uniref:carbohydrate-binding family 9-like protein n=1 Tax=Pareuzebyella sediminis TaxID=2607998 RepID=UPI0018E158A6|nr:carbohydrate-binding family 9-like protein [Pareuzebyella sediminis]